MLILYSEALLVLDFNVIIDKVLLGMRIVLLLVLFYDFYLKKYYSTNLDKLLGIFLIYLVPITLLNSGHIIALISLAISVAVLLIIFKHFAYKDILKYSSVILSVIVYLNFVLTLKSVDAHYYIEGKPVFLLGRNYNAMGPTLLMAIITNAMYGSVINGNKINLLIISFVSVFTLFLVGSMTSLVGVSCMILFIYIFCKFKARLINKIFFIVVVVAFILLIFLQVSIDNGFILWFIEELLGKDTTFSSRSIIWMNSIEKINQSMWTGYGLQTNDWYISSILGFNPHNILLSILLKGGVILLMMYLIIIYLSLKKSKGGPSEMINILHFGCCTFLLMMTMEAYSVFYIFYYVFLNYFSYKIKYGKDYRTTHKIFGNYSTL